MGLNEEYVYTPDGKGGYNIKCGFPARGKALDKGGTTLAEGTKKGGITLAKGTKYDGDKLRTDLVPPECIKAVAWIYTFGANKYDDNNWRKGMKFSRVYGALQRHLLAWYEGENNDPETGKSHTWHAIWGCITLAYYMMYYKIYSKFDDRIINGELK